MLKIKDDVDLKRLNRKPYYFKSVTIEGDFPCLLKEHYVDEVKVNVLLINLYTREIMQYDGCHINDTLYDLIKADLVEKIKN